MFYMVHSLIGGDEGPESYELHVAVKDYCFARDDRLVGVAVLQLRDILEQVRLGCSSRCLSLVLLLLFALYL